MLNTKPTLRRRAVQFVLILLVLYLLMALFVALVQRKLIYYPATFAPEVATQRAQQDGFREWRNGSGELIGWQFSATRSDTGAVLIVHGNGGCAFQRGYFAQPIHAAADVDVFVLEYPGYGCRKGSPSQRTILAAAEDAFEALGKRTPVYIVSESLGAGVAAHLAGKYSARVAGLAMFAPYDKLASVGQSHMSILPVGLLLRDRFHPAKSLEQYGGPLKVVLADSDTIIPPRFGRRLYDSYAGPKSIEVVPGAGHNDIAGQTPEWWKRVFTFWDQHRQRD